MGDIDLNWLSNQLHNSLIETVVISDSNDCIIGDWPEIQFPELKNIEYSPPATIDLNVSDSELIEISEKGLLALNLEEMNDWSDINNDGTVNILDVIQLVNKEENQFLIGNY